MDELEMQDSVLREFTRFLAEERRWWLTPFVVSLGATGALLVAAEGSAVAPFIYALF
jgi:hypothetical protein